GAGGTGGTRLRQAPPSTSAAGTPRDWSIVSMMSPYSSAVCSRRLVSRHDASKRSPSNTPIFVFVLPTSATSSIGGPPLDQLARTGGPTASSVLTAPASTRVTEP